MSKSAGGFYNDYPDYYHRVPRLYQIIGFDGAGTVEQAGPEVRSSFDAGDDLFTPAVQYAMVAMPNISSFHADSVAKKPMNLSFVEVAAIPLT